MDIQLNSSAQRGFDYSRIEWCDRIDEVTDDYVCVSLKGENKRKFNINTLELMESF